MNKKAVAAILDEIGTLLELKGENPFKARAYQNGARVVKSLQKELPEMVESGEIKKIKGIGAALAEKIIELVTTGRLEYYENLRKAFPESIFELLRIPGLGSKKIKKLYDDLGIKSVDELEKACFENTIADIPGFGGKTQAKILENIAFLRKHGSRHLFSVVHTAAQRIFALIESHPKVIRAALTGSLRRHRETVKDIDIVSSARDEDRQEIMDFFTGIDGHQMIIAQGDTKSGVVLKEGVQAELRIVADDEFPYLMHHSTGSKEHNTAMRGYAKRLGLKMNEYGLFRESGERIDCADEREIFAALNMKFVEPELREDMGEIEAALSGDLPELVQKNDIKGILHTHTTFSDGANTLEQMAEACRSLGMQYLGVSDHSQIAVYANGLTPDRLKQQREEIDALNERYDDFKIFHGTECDILADGALDFPDDVLETLDFVVISVHSKLGMGEKEATTRLVKAIQNPLVHILGHPTGRILLQREGYPLNYSEIFAAAKENDVVIEINANPRRFDLDWRYARQAKEAGLLLSVNPDAHSVEGLSDTFWGVGIARKGWLTAVDVLNTKSRGEIEEFFARKHEQR